MTDVKEMAIKQLEEKIAHLQATTVSKDKYNHMKIDFEEAENERVRNYEEYKKMEEAYHQQRSMVINFSAEVENARHELLEMREDFVKVGKENEHLRGLVKLWL
jgi:chromosome segregation ATPase